MKRKNKQSLVIAAGTKHSGTHQQLAQKQKENTQQTKRKLTDACQMS